MKALVKAKSEPGIWLQDINKPDYGHNDVLIKVNKTAICGTDMHIFNWDTWSQQTIQIPMTIGHEFSGEVVAIGREVTGINIGDRVSGEGHITCGICRNCRAGRRYLCRNCLGTGVHRPGAFAEYMIMPATNVFLLPDDISDDIASIMDPFGNAVHTALSFDLVGEDVLITGAGPIGIMAAAVAQHAGARHVVITDINEYRLDLVRSMGHAHAINVQQTTLPHIMKKLNMQEGFDVGLEMSGNAQAFHDMIASMNHGGRIAMLGIPPNTVTTDWSTIIFKALTIKGIYGRKIFDTWYKMVSIVQSGLDITPVITHHFPAADYKDAFATMGSGQSGKVVLDWN